MTSYEYLSTLLSIIIGLGITHLLVGIGRIINNPKGVKPYWIHLVWTLAIFIYLIQYWWFEYKLISILEWTFRSLSGRLFISAYSFEFGPVQLRDKITRPHDGAGQYGGEKGYEQKHVHRAFHQSFPVTIHIHGVA